MLDGENVKLRILEKEDVPLLAKWIYIIGFKGQHVEFPRQISRVQLEKAIFQPEIPQMQWVDFIIQKKDETEIGWIFHFISSQNFGWVEIGMYLIPCERRKGYGTEATQIMVDYLFLTKDIPRIQAVTSVKNRASQRALEKAGFQREGILRRALWAGNGQWTDGYMYSVIKEEWIKPKILARTTS